jgi:hypothetical protein
MYKQLVKNKDMSILVFWNQMSQVTSTGLVKRLFKPTNTVMVYATYNHTDKMCGIAISYDKTIRVDVTPFSSFSELSVNIYGDQGKNLLTIQLKSISNRDIFAVLCDNLVQTIDQCVTEQDAVRLVLNRLEKWKTLLQKGVSEGLSKSEQQGLYGELTYLEKLLDSNIFTPLDAVSLWVGVDRTMRDFQGKDWAVEVKTISTTTPNQIKINGERQLDETLLRKLYLYHLTVEASDQNGENLNHKVEVIKNKLINHLSALSAFNEKLIEVGYFDKHKNLYVSRCYQTRREVLYCVDNQFPRIKESELRDGICNVEYSINVSNCGQYIVSEVDHFNDIK